MEKRGRRGFEFSFSPRDVLINVHRRKMARRVEIASSLHFPSSIVSQRGRANFQSHLERRNLSPLSLSLSRFVRRETKSLSVAAR